MSLGLVTGRQYKKTRVRGYAPWEPRQDARDIIERVQEIITEYSQPLTIRQIFYRLVGKHGYEKTEQAYSRLGEYLNRARRAVILDWDSFRDDGDIVPSIPGWSGPKQFWNVVRANAVRYFRTPEGDHYVEVWCETAGMAPQIQAIANEFGVRVIASGGFSSVTARRNAALRLIDKGTERVIVSPNGAAALDRCDVHVLLIGDYDPSGQSIIDSTCEDVSSFARHEAEFEFEHLAVTPEQAEEYNLESAPQKETDKRGPDMAETYQAEALDPDVLAGIVRDRLLDLIGEDALTEAKRLTELERAEILLRIDGQEE